jgi:hypothetical protein
MSIIMLITLVVIFAVILAARRSRRGPRVMKVDRTVRRRKGDGE